MCVDDVAATLDRALSATGLDRVTVENNGRSQQPGGLGVNDWVGRWRRPDRRHQTNRRSDLARQFYGL